MGATAASSRKASRSFRDEQAVTAIEYALIGSLVALAIVVGVSSLGREVDGAYRRIATAVLDVLN